MIDGLDGLCGGIGLILLGFLTLYASFAGVGEMYLPIVLPFFGALAGFYLLNARLPFQSQAKVFFGDSGSLALGALVAWLATCLSGDGRFCIVLITFVP